MMLPDTRARLDTAAAELRKLLVGDPLCRLGLHEHAHMQADENPAAQEDASDSVRDSEEATKAASALEEAQEFLDQGC